MPLPNFEHLSYSELLFMAMHCCSKLNINSNTLFNLFPILIKILFSLFYLLFLFLFTFFIDITILLSFFFLSFFLQPSPIPSPPPDCPAVEPKPQAWKWFSSNRSPLSSHISHKFPTYFSSLSIPWWWDTPWVDRWVAMG